MTTKTRYFMLGSAGILVAGLCTGLAAYYGGLPMGTAFAQADGVSELHYIPSDAAVVAYANVKDVMASDLRRRLQAIQPGGDKGRQHFQEQTGINLETDVDTVVAAMLPTAGKGEALAIIKGRFNEVRLEAFARERGGVVEQYHGTRIITKKDSDESGALALLGPGLLAVGESTAVRRAIDGRSGGLNVTRNVEMMKLVGDIDGGTNAWAVGRFDVLATHARFPDSIASQLPAIQWFTAAGRVDGGVTGHVRAETRDDEAASNLRDVLRGFLALARIQVGARPEFQTMLESLELGGTGKTVALSFSIPAQFFEAMAPRMRQPAEQ